MRFENQEVFDLSVVFGLRFFEVVINTFLK